MNKFGNEYVDKYIKKNVNKNTVSYNVFIWRHDLQVNERFETLEKAKAFRDEALRLCELKRIESIRASLEITEYPYNLINALEFDVASVIEHFEERFEVVSSKHLTPREDYVMKQIYQLHYTLDGVGKELGLTRERIRQILTKALRKIKYHKKYFEIGDYAYPEKVAKEELKKYIEEHKRYLDYESAKKFIEEYEQTNEYRDSYMRELPIEELDLSVRSYHCLKRACVNYLKNLLELNAEDLIKIKNMGRKSQKEIVEKVHSLGYKLKGEK